MAGTFRLVTNQSHTRFEGEKRHQRKTYYGAGHPRARHATGDLIHLDDKELDRFKNPRDRLRLVDGDWSKALRQTIALEEEVVDKPDPVDLLLANNVDIVVGELKGLDIDELERVLDIELAGAARKGITRECERLLEELSDE
jgi:hypothetical protein